MSIQYMVPGLKLTTLEHESPPITTGPGLPPNVLSFLPSDCTNLWDQNQLYCSTKKCWRQNSFRKVDLKWQFGVIFDDWNQRQSLVNIRVTRKKSPNVYKSWPKMFSIKKWMILTPLQKLPKNVGDLGKSIVAKGFIKLPKV